DCPFRYQGQYQDEETGLYYNRFRYYDPSIGAYLSQDPIGLAGGDRLYSYVHDTNIWIDTLGLTRSIRTQKLPKALQRRPKWRQSVIDQLNMTNPKTADGKFVDVKTGKPIEPGNEVIGHQHQSWREYQEDPTSAQKTRSQVIDDYNDVSNLGYEDKSSSSSDGGRLKGHEH
ncbi:MAG: RHS repeat-associated core domain-containing protein, partial [Endomicrobium sp.]|nr:RHS repeat-associated core domain-containing protein [Endomicrobium sp.]